MAICNAAVFDLGGVRIDRDPRRVYRKILPTEVEVEQFLSTVCTLEWDAKQDAGRSLGEGIAELVARFPGQTLLSCSAPQRISASNFLVLVSSRGEPPPEPWRTDRAPSGIRLRLGMVWASHALARGLGEKPTECRPTSCYIEGLSAWRASVTARISILLSALLLLACVHKYAVGGHPATPCGIDKCHWSQYSRNR